MGKPLTKKKFLKETKKEVRAEIIRKLADALKEYKTPKFDKKLMNKIKKAGKSITPFVLKSIKETAEYSEKKSA